MGTPDSADGLDAALDAVVGRGPGAPDAADESLIAAARALKAALYAYPSPQAKARHVQMLMDSARAPQTVVPVAPGPRRARRRAPFLKAAFSLGLAALLAVPATAALAGQAKPGERLYGVKLAVEKVRLAAAGDPDSEVRLHVEFAQRRLEELSQAVGTNVDERSLKVALDNLEAHQRAAGKAVEVLRSKPARTPPAAREGSGTEETVAAAVSRHEEVLTGLAARANCTGTPEAPQGDPQCHGLLTALANSQKVKNSLERAGDRGRASKETERPAPPAVPASEAGDDDDAGRRPSESPSAPPPGARPGLPDSAGRDSDSQDSSNDRRDAPRRIPERAGMP